MNTKFISKKKKIISNKNFISQSIQHNYFTIIKLFRFHKYLIVNNKI